MSHPVFALYHRAIRQDTRSFETYGRRGGLLAVIFFALMMAKETSSLFGAPGQRFFQSVIIINCVYITLTGLSFFASAITEEKEEQTLGLLRMTALSPVAILLGKSTPRLIATLLLIVAQFPFTLLAVTLGGVSLSQIVAAYLTLTAYTVFLCNLALFWSVIFKRTGNAAGMVGLCLLGFFTVPFWGQAMIDEIALGDSLAEGGTIHTAISNAFDLLKSMSVFVRLHDATSTGFSGGVVGIQFVSNLLLGGLFFVFSWAVFDRFTRTSAPSQRRFLLLRGKDRRGIRGLFSPGRSWQHMPIAWKDFTYTCGGIAGVVMRLGILLLVLGLVCLIAFQVNPGLKLFSSDFRRMISVALMGSVLPAAVLEMAFAASNVFQSEIRWKTLSNLALLPLSTGALIRQKIAGYAIPMAAYVALFLIAGMLSPSTLENLLGDMFGEAHGWYMISMVVLGLYLTAFFSIVLKRGAVAVALLAVFFGNTMFSLASAILFIWSRNANAFLVLTITIHFGIAILLHTQIPGLLERKVAEA